MVTIKQWKKAQLAERDVHHKTYAEGREHYGKSYAQYFNHLGIDPDLNGRNVVEIGPADFPALSYCRNIGAGCFVIEPMPSDLLKKSGLTISTELAENMEYKADEVWLFNVLQHVVDPDKIVQRAKNQADVIRFFEPIDYGTDKCHLWDLTKEMFVNWFGDCVRDYVAAPDVVNFHTWPCAYGVWHSTNKL